MLKKKCTSKNYIITKTIKITIIKNNFFFLLKHIIMVKLTKNELRLIARNSGIKNYKNMSREKLLSAIV